ncbi:MAG: PEP-CTERM sorting domain-containing protein [Edaphobacter sp.]
MPIRSRLFAFAILIASTLAGHADAVQFSFTQSTEDTFSFIAPLSPTDLLIVSSSSFLLFPNELQGTFDNGPLPTEVIFEIEGLHLGNDIFLTQGSPIYTLKGGNPDMPTFNIGTFGGVLEYKGGVPFDEGTLTITDVGTIGPDSPPTPTPEPSTLALFCTGVPGLTGVARRKLLDRRLGRRIKTGQRKSFP